MISNVCSELLKLGMEVKIVKTESETLFSKSTHHFDVPIYNWTDTNLIENLIQNSDVLIYQIGNNYDFHQGGVEWLSKNPGIVCLHDFFLGHLFWGWSNGKRENASIILKYLYGENEQNRYFNYHNSTDFINGTLSTAPMTEWICSMAYSVITHSRFGVDRVLSSCPGPVQVVPLAYDIPFDSIKTNEEKAFLKEKKLRLLTFGYINDNKRITSIIRAIGSSAKLKTSLIYQLVGQVEHNMMHDLTTLANSLNVNLSILGSVDDLSLANIMSNSDIICCLRWPSLETSSASAIEALLHGKPVIVTNTGFYKELPQELVFKIEQKSEIPDLVMHLENLISNEELRLTVGKKAQEWATNTFSARNYAHQLLNVTKATMKSSLMLNNLKVLIDSFADLGATDLSFQDTNIFSSLEIMSTYSNSHLYNTSDQSPII